MPPADALVSVPPPLPNPAYNRRPSAPYPTLIDPNVLKSRKASTNGPAIAAQVQTQSVGEKRISRLLPAKTLKHAADRRTAHPAPLTEAEIYKRNMQKKMQQDDLDYQSDNLARTGQSQIPVSKAPISTDSPFYRPTTSGYVSDGATGRPPALSTLQPYTRQGQGARGALNSSKDLDQPSHDRSHATLNAHSRSNSAPGQRSRTTSDAGVLGAHPFATAPSQNARQRHHASIPVSFPVPASEKSRTPARHTMTHAANPKPSIAHRPSLPYASDHENIKYPPVAGQTRVQLQADKQSNSSSKGSKTSSIKKFFSSLARRGSTSSVNKLWRMGGKRSDESDDDSSEHDVKISGPMNVKHVSGTGALNFKTVGVGRRALVEDEDEPVHHPVRRKGSSGTTTSSSGHGHGRGPLGPAVTSSSGTTARSRGLSINSQTTKFGSQPSLVHPLADESVLAKLGHFRSKKEKRMTPLSLVDQQAAKIWSEVGGLGQRKTPTGYVPPTRF